MLKRISCGDGGQDCVGLLKAVWYHLRTMAESERFLIDLLERVIPFRFLKQAQKQELAAVLFEHRFSTGEVIIRQGDPSDRKVYMLASGSVEVVDHKGEAARVVNVIISGHYFGEWEPLFEVERAFEIRATEPSVCYAMEGDRFLSLLQTSRPFAQALGTILRDKQRIFTAFDRFKVELLRAVNRGYINLSELLPLYMDVDPALHPKCRDEHAIDFAGLTYAIRRLPDNVTRTFAYLLTDELPPAYGAPARFFPSVGTTARRRDIWEMLPGKSLVLLRNGDSDLVDLITCLCVYAVEARKIRHRISNPVSLELLERYVGGQREDGPQVPTEFLRELPFSEEDVRGLISTWPSRTVERLREIARHREMFNIDVRRQTSNYNSRRTDLWTAQVANATRELLGVQPSALDESVRVHIISSNTHSVTNCVNPWFPAHADEVLRWARSTEHPVIREEWANEFDPIFAMARDYFTAHPEAARESLEWEEEYGILRMKETASTGIQVQLIDGARLSGRQIDPAVTAVPEGSRDVIVNIDYAFGEQAQHIMRNLLMLFGGNLASINFLGKAGALLGHRGDILAPTAFIEQTSDYFQPLPAADGSCIRCLEERLPDHTVHQGPLLTVEGTLLQNRLMLNFYRKVWGCIGMEMEGAHYYRQVVESAELGVVRSGLPLRFFYYVSDLPLQSDSSLAARLHVQEGIPPLYAITRQILSDIFGTSQQSDN